MKRRVNLFSLMVGISLSIILMTSGTSTGEMLGSDAPDFVLTDLNGRPFQLTQNLDKHIILVYMQVYCHTCRQEVPLINQIQREYPNIHVIGISLGNDEAEVSEFKKVFHAQFTILPDPKKEILKKYLVSTVPLIDVIDKTGTIRYRGKLDALQDFKDILDAILQEKEVVGSDLWNKPPAFTLKTSEGQEISFQDILARKTILLTFFSLDNAMRAFNMPSVTFFRSASGSDSRNCEKTRSLV